MSDNTVDSLLRRCGWDQGRLVDVTSALAGIRRAGYPIWPELTEFLSEFNGLTIESADGARRLTIDATQAARNADQGWLSDYSRVAGCDLSPVGEYSHMIFLMGRDGRFYGGFDNAFGPMGEDFRGAVSGLLEEVPPRALQWDLDEAIPE